MTVPHPGSAASAHHAPSADGARPDERAPLALIAGGSRGLGLQLARELGRRGHRIAICAREPEALQRAADLLSAEGHDVVARSCDVGDAEAVDALVTELERDHGPIETMICVAGVIQVGPLASLDRSHIESAVRTMLWGPVNTGLAVQPAMVRRGRGRIAVITSVGGLIAAPHLLPYSTAKFGAVGFSKSLRNELSGTGVTVTTVIPGLMRTGSDVHARFTGDQAREFGWFSVAAAIPLLSVNVERAARRIVDAVLAGRATLALTPLTMVAPRVEALAPRTTAALLGLTTRLLPSAPAEPTGSPTVDGFTARRRMTGPGRALADRLTVLARRAGSRLNQQAEHDGADGEQLGRESSDGSTTPTR